MPFSSFLKCAQLLCNEEMLNFFLGVVLLRPDKPSHHPRMIGSATVVSACIILTMKVLTYVWKHHPIQKQTCDCIYAPFSI